MFPLEKLATFLKICISDRSSKANYDDSKDSNLGLIMLSTNVGASNSFVMKIGYSSSLMMSDETSFIGKALPNN